MKPEPTLFLGLFSADEKDMLIYNRAARCQSLFLPAFSLAERSPGNEVGPELPYGWQGMLLRYGLWKSIPYENGSQKKSGNLSSLFKMICAYLAIVMLAFGMVRRGGSRILLRRGYTTKK